MYKFIKFLLRKRKLCTCFKYVETNQQKIVEAGGLSSLLMLLRSTEDETIHRVAAGAIANLAMNGWYLFLVRRNTFPTSTFETACFFFRLRYRFI